MLSLLLVQFDATFEWSNDGSTINVVQIPDRVGLEMQHSTRRLSSQEALALVRRELPDIDISASERTLTAYATVEEHDTIATLLDPRRAEKKKKRNERPRTGATPLDRRLFTFAWKNGSAADLFSYLNENGVEVRFDRDALEAAGAKLDTPIEMDVNQVKVDEFFSIICDQFGVGFEVKQFHVEIVPK